MTPESADDLSLSVWADWLDDELRPNEATQVRDSLVRDNSDLNWEYQYRGSGSVGGVGRIGSVGSVVGAVDVVGVGSVGRSGSVGSVGSVGSMG